MEKSHKDIYLKIRAEQIKMQHDTINKGLFPGGYPFEAAHEIASQQLEMDLKCGRIRISIDELLTLDVNKSVCLIEQRMEEAYNN